MESTVHEPARAANIEAIVGYLKNGIKNECDAVGIELEHILVHDDGTPVVYSDEHGQHEFLEIMSSDYPVKVDNQDGELIGLARSGSSVTLEPGSQMELSAGPFTDLHQAKKTFYSFENQLKEIVLPYHIDVMTIGYHPTCRAKDLRLLPKKRYEYMDRYFKTISPFGTCMMRGSASTQVSIDYSSIDDCLNKLRLANACVPVFSLICDNTPIFETEPRPHFMMRTEIWNKCDPDRCMLIPGSMNDDFTLEDYAEYILDTPAIVSIVDGKEEYSTQTFGEIFAERTMTVDDIEHALSMLFTDVRLKQYIEIRPADAMPVEHAIAYAALIKGLFYNDESLEELGRLMKGIKAADIANAKCALMKNGYSAEIYGHSAADLATSLVRLARMGLDEDEQPLLAPLSNLVEGNVTLADLETP